MEGLLVTRYLRDNDEQSTPRDSPISTVYVRFYGIKSRLISKDKTIEVARHRTLDLQM